MAKYRFPAGMRYSTLEERSEFYQNEFDLARVRGWFRREQCKVVFAVIMGRHTRIYPKEYEEDASTTIIIDAYQTLDDVKKQIVEFLPEAVYYDRNVYSDKGETLGQELAFDLDPENLTCPIHGTLTDKMKRHQGLSFCKIELEMVKEETAKLHEELTNSFSQLKIVYSGRGFHIHVFDKDSFQWSYEKRKKFAEKMKEKGFPIDEWVTSGGMRLIRLPYSLHGMVSRIVTPLDIKELKSFDPIRDERCKPRFFKP